jgi:ribosomal protein S18 acetylase RimI-like enzyme
LNFTHLDADDFFWAESEIPFTIKRPREECIAKLLAAAECEDFLDLSERLGGDIQRFADVLEREMQNTVSYRLKAIPMAAQDIPFLHSLFKDPINKNALHAKDFTLAEWQETFAASQTDSDEELFIITQNGIPVAWLKINGLDGDTAWIAMLVVDSQHHRQGIGSFAVRFAEEYVLARGFTQIGIHTTVDNISAQECYTKAGYTITDSGECHGSDGVNRNGYTLMKSFWFHGSPLELTELAPGSTITRWKALAQAFSHKPSTLEYDHVGGEIKHNGALPGFLYVIDEPVVEDEDITKHPATSMDDGVEWLTKRALKLRKIGGETR